MARNTPEFIKELKKQTIMSTDRSKLYVRPLNEKRSKLKKISETENVSEQKLIEFAIDLLWEKWESDRRAG